MFVGKFKSLEILMYSLGHTLDFQPDMVSPLPNIVPQTIMMKNHLHSSSNHSSTGCIMSRSAASRESQSMIQELGIVCEVYYLCHCAGKPYSQLNNRVSLSHHNCNHIIHNHAIQLHVLMSLYATNLNWLMSATRNPTIRNWKWLYHDVWFVIL